MLLIVRVFTRSSGGFGILPWTKPSFRLVHESISIAQCHDLWFLESMSFSPCPSEEGPVVGWMSSELWKSLKLIRFLSVDTEGFKQEMSAKSGLMNVWISIRTVGSIDETKQLIDKKMDQLMN